MPSSRLPLAGLFVLFIGVAGSVATTHAATPALPNVVFILADDLGWADTTLYGHTKFHETPNLQRLARRGMTFTQAYSANPLCSPTRASILTGLYPGRIGITSPAGHLPEVKLEASLAPRAPAHQKARTPVSATRLAPDRPTLPRSLKAAGYATGHFGKWHLGTAPYSPLEHGFEVDVPHHNGPGPAGSFVAPWKFPAALNFTGRPGEHIEDRMADEALRFIDTHRDRPFFLNYWAFSVHAPFDGKTGLIAKYRAKADPADAQRCPVYGAMVQSLDENVGRLLDRLDALQLSERTIIVFFSDNGGNMYDRIDGIPPTSNRPLRGGKATLFEGGTRVPCIVVWPGRVAPGSTSDALFSSVDFLPTLLAMTGVPAPAGATFDGVNQVPALLGQGAPRDAAFCYFPHYTPATGNIPGVWVRRGPWKLLRFFHDGPAQDDRHELYRLDTDLGETRDLAAAEPSRVRELGALIDAHLRAMAPVLPVRTPAYDPAAPPPAPRAEKGPGKAKAAK
jgi:arylsulfatase A-like enzyme